METQERQPARSKTFRQRVRAILGVIPGAVPLVRLVVETVRLTFRYRVTGLSAEAGFFMLLSLPPLLLGLFAGVGYFGQRLSENSIAQLTGAIEEFAGRFLTTEIVDDIITPTVNATLQSGRADLLSIGFVLSLWAGSRALHVFMDTISIMYGQGGVRGIIGSRVVSISLYLASLLIGAVLIPLVLVGPDIISSWLPEEFQWVMAAYWPVVGILGLAGLTGLYHFSTPHRSRFIRDVPGALLAVGIWVVVSWFLRAWLSRASGSAMIFGPLTAPIIALIFFYVIAIAILIGAALNAAIRRLWPPAEYRGPVVRASEWWEHRKNANEPKERHSLTPVDRRNEKRPSDETMSHPSRTPVGEDHRDRRSAEFDGGYDEGYRQNGSGPTQAGPRGRGRSEDELYRPPTDANRY